MSRNDIRFKYNSLVPHSVIVNVSILTLEKCNISETHLKILPNQNNLNMSQSIINQ